MRLSLSRLRFPAPRYRLRTLFALVTLAAVGIWVYLEFPNWRRAWDIRQARGRISQYERTVAGDGDSNKAPPELVAVLGDSRLKHWGGVGTVENGPADRLVSFGRDGRFRVWDMKTGEQTFVTRAKLLTCSVDGTKVFFVNEDNELVVWDVATAKETGKLPTPELQPIGRMVANLDGSVLAARSGDKTAAAVHVWNVATGQIIASWLVAYTHGMGLSLSRDGKLLATINEIDADIWDITTREKIRHLPAVRGERGDIGRLYAVVFSADNKQVITGGAIPNVYVWDLATGERELLPLNLRSSVHGIALDRTGRSLIIGGGRSATNLFLEKGRWRVGSQHNFAMDVHAGNSDSVNLRAYGHYDGPITLWQQSTPLRLARSLDIDIACLAFTPDGKYLITGGRNGELALWHCGSWTLHKSWQGHTDYVRRVAASPVGRVFASSSDDRNVVVWDIDKQQQVTTFSASPSSPSLVFLPDGQSVIIGQHWSIPICLHDAATGQRTSTFKAGPKIHVRGEIVPTPDGKLLVSGGSSSTLILWDVEKQAAVRELGEYSLDNVPVAVAPDGTWAAAGTRQSGFAAWNLETGDEWFSVKGHTDLAKSVAISPDGRLIATAAADGTAKLWSAADGSLVHAFELCPPSGLVRQVAFSPDGSYLATVNGNGTAYILDLKGISAGARQ